MPRSGPRTRLYSLGLGGGRFPRRRGQLWTRHRVHVRCLPQAAEQRVRLEPRRNLAGVFPGGDHCQLLFADDRPLDRPSRSPPRRRDLRVVLRRGFCIAVVVGRQPLATVCDYIAIGLVGNGATQLPYSRVITEWFDQRRGLALSLMMTGVGAGVVVMPALAQWLIDEQGWRAAYLLLGLVMLLAAVPLPAFLLGAKSAAAAQQSARNVASSSGGLQGSRPVRRCAVRRSGRSWAASFSFRSPQRLCCPSGAAVYRPRPAGAAGGPDGFGAWCRPR